MDSQSTSSEGGEYAAEPFFGYDFSILERAFKRTSVTYARLVVDIEVMAASWHELLDEIHGGHPDEFSPDVNEPYPF